MRILRYCAFVAVGLYLGILGIFFVSQRSLLYYPTHNWVALNDAHANPSFKDFPVRTEDGIELKGWFAPATSKRYIFVFFHGNADNLASASSIADPYLAAGYGFLVTEYQGYSGLPGKPTEAGLYADGRAYIRGLMAQGVKSEDIILFGHSLGTGVAVQMAEEFHVGGLILLAPYLSIPKIAQVEYPFLPAGILALDRFENFRKMKSIHVPVLILNGTDDQVIPPSQGKQLFELANEPRQFESLPNHGHNDLFGDSAPIGLDWVVRVCGKDRNLNAHTQM